jgi:uncharacterized membrane protein
VVRRALARYTRDESEFDRAVAFVDATFAVALTLLATTLDLESDPSTWNSIGDLFDAMGSQLLAFAISFVVIAGYWLAHYRLIATFAGIDISVIAVNLFLLAAIVMIPFTTESVGDPGIDDLPLPTVILAVNVAAVSTAFTLVYVVARRRGLLRATPTRQEFTWNVLGMLSPAVVFLASVPIAYLAAPGTAQLAWLSLVVISPLLGEASKRGKDSATTPA